MKKRYVLALVVVEQVREGDPDGNGAWLESEQKEWTLVEEYPTQSEAERASFKLHCLYEDTIREQ